MPTAHIRTLRRALEVCGGRVDTLARTLNVSPQALSAWLNGRETPPTQVYLAALDVVARGPLRAA